ncbi:MAG TPA: aldolase [Candidatus Faecivicinus avistercoris]|nr:aldolase [Candidatus Faecivicinus avistercoris]
MYHELTHSIRRSKVLEKIRSGKIACSIKVNVSGQEATEIAAMSGFDCVWTCMEHCPTSIDTVKKQVAVCKAHDADLLVRVPRGSYSEYIRPLEMDATGIMVPHVMSLEDAKRIVSQTRFQPVGRRPVDGGNGDGQYGLLSIPEYLRQSNENKMVILQIEDPEPLERDLEAICELPGYDILFFGPGDFSHITGHADDIMHEDVIAARRKIARAARKYGKPLGTVCVGDPRILIDEGFQLLNLGSDVNALTSFYREKRRGFYELLEEMHQI